MSPRCEEIFGYSSKEFHSDTELWERMILPEDREIWSDLISGLRKTRHSSAEYRIVRKDGTIRWVRDSLTAVVNDDGSIQCVNGIVADITEQKMAKAEVDKVQTMLDQGLDAIYVIDAESYKVIECNQTACEMLQYSREEIVNMQVFDIEKGIKPDWKEINEIVFGPEYQDTIPGIHRRKDGTKFPVEVKAKVKKIDDKEYIVAVVSDITERKKTENAFRESEERYRFIFDHTFFGIAQFRRKGNFVKTNQAFQKMLGYSEKELRYLTIFDVIHPERNDQTKRQIEDLFTGKQEKLSGELRFIHKNSSIAWLYFNVFLVRNSVGKPKHFVAIIEDISERKKMELDLIKKQKFESLSVLAGGIAHDFNNMLSSIGLNVALAKNLLHSKEKADKLLSNTENAVRNAAALTMQLQTFAKGGSLFRKPTSIDTLLAETVEFTLRGSNVKSEIIMPEDLWNADIDEVQISQVIQNLVINAKQAMPDGGNVEITAENKEISHDNSLSLLAGKFVKITVKDFGTGIDQNDLNKIFDPYFTTKKKGTGLGLSMSHTLIKSHDGHISASPLAGKGTTFYIYLPATVTELEHHDQIDELFPITTCKILIMEDEADLSAVLKEALEIKGFTVEISADGREAINKYSDVLYSDDPFRYVAMDLKVPGGMGGSETIQRLAEIDRNVNAIVMSGSIDDPAIKNYKDYGFKGVITKPFQIEDLANLLNKMMIEEITDNN